MITAVSKMSARRSFRLQLPKSKNNLIGMEPPYQVDCHVRAQSFPSTYTVLGDLRIKVWAGAPMDYKAKPRRSVCRARHYYGL